MAVWEAVAELTAAAQAEALDPHAWALRVAAELGAAGVALPSPELARRLVSHVLWGNSVPAAWKYLEKAVASSLAPPALVVALLSTRIIPSRRCAPVAYRLYMEILRRHSIYFASQILGTTCKEILMSIDDTLCLSQIFGVQANEPGVLLVEFIVCIVWQLLDATLDDEGLLDSVPDKSSRWALSLHKTMEIEDHHLVEKAPELSDRLHKANTVMAIEIIAQFLHHKIIYRLISLAHQNMFSCMEDFVQRLHLLGAKSMAVRNSTVSPKLLIQCLPGDFRKSSNKFRSSPCRRLCAFFSRPLASPLGHHHGANSSAIWLPLDLYLEDCLDGTVAATNAIKVISGLLRAIQSVNKTTWHDAFLALWVASLRLVQRERDPIEGPIPHIDTRMSILLPISTLSVADIIDEENSGAYPAKEGSTFDSPKQNLAGKLCQEALITSLQMLGDFEALLTPPPSIVSLANQAAAKAMMFVSGFPVGGGSCGSIDASDMALNCSGNLRHLIVESCIARNVVDTSAYYWPGYVNGRINQIPHNMPSRLHGWSSIMKGSSLTSSVLNTLMNTPASSLAELEKIFEIAVHGSDGERVFAASVLCGASLARGWNIQEHTVRLVVKLLHPPAPVDYSGSMHYLISHGPVLNILLAGISSLDCVQIFSFHGLVPALAGALMEICEVFGSCSPGISWTLHTGEEISPLTVFSNSFVLFLRLWKFNQTPIEHCMMGDGASVGSQLTLEYLVLLHNSQFVSSSCVANEGSKCKKILVESALDAPIFLDSFPKLKVWYRQNQACLASTLSGLVPGTPVHQNVDILLSMMFRNINKGSNHSVGSGSSASTGLSSCSVGDDTTSRPSLPAWDILEAVPYVVDAALTACSHGMLSPRELATGLKGLADFIPASLGTMVSYFSSEVTRGVWKPANMNGTDWPSPAGNLSTVEERIKKIVAATGVHVPSLVTAVSSPITLPLPLAAFASLTITYKLDRASARCLDLVGPALENLAASCPWPSMPIVAALWVQKVKRWNDFLSFSASRTVFIHNRTAVVQLLKSCFAAATGLSTDLASGDGGVGALLGHDFAAHFCDGLSPIAPGILYLRTHRTTRDVIQLTGDILTLLVAMVREVANDGLQKGSSEEPRKRRHGMKYGQVSPVATLTRVKAAASLGATLVWLSGGSSPIQWLFLEMLPSWFLSKQHAAADQCSDGAVAMLEGYALAYFAILCGKFAWETDSAPVLKRRKKVVEAHMAFLADALEGKILLGCSSGTWRAYVSVYLGLMADCAPGWVSEVEPGLLRRVGTGLRHLNEPELAILMLASGGVPSMGAAAEFIVGSEVV